MSGHVPFNTLAVLRFVSRLSSAEKLQSTFSGCVGREKISNANFQMVSTSKHTNGSGARQGQGTGPTQ